VTPGAYEVLVDLVDPPVTDYTCEVSSVDVQNTPNNITIPASFCANGYNDVGSVSQQLVLTVLCDWEAMDSLAWFLQDNAGKEGYVKLVKSPAATGLPSFVAHVRFVAPNITFATGTAAIATVTMPVFGLVPTKPTSLAAASAAPASSKQAATTAA
jgi:hypothetical protein